MLYNRLSNNVLNHTTTRHLNTCISLTHYAKHVYGFDISFAMMSMFHYNIDIDYTTK